MFQKYRCVNQLTKSTQEATDSGAPQSSTQYMVETELLGVIATLPLSCRDVIFSQRGLVAQLAMVALMEKEKFGKNYARVKRASRRNHWLVKRLLRRLQPKAKHKIIRKVLKKEKLRGGRSVLFGKIKLSGHRKKHKAIKALKKKAATKKHTKKKPSRLRSKIKTKLFKKSVHKKSSYKAKSIKVKKTTTSKGMAKLIAKGKPQKATSTKKLQKVSMKGKGKLFFLKKPGAKDIDKFKKLVAKKVKAKAYQKEIQAKKVKQKAGDDQKQAKLKLKSSFFKATVKASSQTTKVEKVNTR